MDTTAVPQDDSTPNVQTGFLSLRVLLCSAALLTFIYYYARKVANHRVRLCEPSTILLNTS